MSPIPSLAPSPTLFTSAPLPSPGQSDSTASQYILGTGGFLFAVVAIVSVAGYFCHGRGTANAAQRSNAWASLTGLLSSVRNIGSTPTSTAATTDWPVYLENGPDHINMVYAKFFHPTFWNLVECHAATTLAPAIFVEEEAIEVPKADPKPFGLNSFLNMDEDGEDRDRKVGTTPSHEKSEKDTKARVGQVPPYDTSSSTNVSFVSKIIGTTVRPGGFLYVPGQDEDDPSESSDLDSELDFGSLAYDGIVTAPLTPRPTSRRHGMADMGHLADSLKGALTEEREGMVPTVSLQAGLADILELLETEHVLSCTPPHGLQTVEGPTTPDVEASTLVAACNHDLEPRRNILSQQAADNAAMDWTPHIPSLDSSDDFAVTSNDADTLGIFHSSVDFMWKLYDDCLKAVGDTLGDGISTSESESSHGTQYDRGDTELIESCEPLRLRAKDKGSVAPHHDSSAHNDGYRLQSSLSKRHAVMEQSNLDDNISSYDSCDSFQGGSGDIECPDEPDELEDLMSQIHTECLLSTNHESVISDWDVAVDDNQNDMRCKFRSISLDSQGTAHQKGPSIAPSFPSKRPGDSDSGTLDHDPGFYEGYDSSQDSSTDIDTSERPEDLEDLMAQIHAEYLYWSKSVEADTLALKDSVVHDGCDDKELGTRNADAPETSHEGPDLMQRILAELRDPGLDINARDISEDSGSEYSDDEEEEASRNSRRNSLESSCSSNFPLDSDVSDEGSIYPLTPPPMSAISVTNAARVLDDRMSPPDTPNLHKEVQAAPSLSMLSPTALSREVYFPDSYLDRSSQDLSNDTCCKHSDATEGKANIPRLRLPLGPHNGRQISLDCTASNTGIDSHKSDKGGIYPLTPLSPFFPPVTSASDVWKGRMSLENPLGLVQEVEVISPFSCHSPPALPTKAYIPSHRNSRSTMYGPRLPLLDLPRI